MLYRRRKLRCARRWLTWTLAVAVCAAVLGGAGLAQRKTRRDKGPRALALVEWVGAGAPRVIPIAIMVDGQFYDASIYKADPVPMALDSGTVYEVEQSGESVGLVTLTDARQTAQGAWFGDGHYQTNTELAAAKAPRKPALPPSEEQEGPPKLRREPARSTTANTSAPPAASPAPRPSGPDEPPVLHKPSTPSQQPTASTAPAAQPVPAKTQAQPDESGRPVLRRGRPSAEQAETLPADVTPVTAPKPGAPASAASRKPATAARRVLPAISDAAGPEPHSYLFPWRPDEQQRLTSAVEALASAALQTYAHSHPGATPGKLENVQVRAFDLDFNNSPDLVLMATAAQAPAPVASARKSAALRRPAGAEPPPPLPATGLTYWVTVVAREDLNGDLRKLMIKVTDSRHLDAFPRTELIDAVDANGDGRGELLFREISDIDRNYVIYRVTLDTLTPLFNSAALQQ